MSFSDSDLDDNALLEALDAFETPRKGKEVPMTPPPSVKKKKQWLPKEEWLKQQSWYGKKKERVTRKRKSDDWDSGLSDEGNTLRQRKKRLKNMRRRARASPPPKPFWERGKDMVASRTPGTKRQRAKLRPVEDTFTPSAGSKEPVEIQLARYKRVRRADRSVTPEWLVVPKEDRRKYSKLTYLDGDYVALRENTLREFEGEMTDPDEEGVDEDCRKCCLLNRDCTCGDETINMGKLFSFMY